ALPQLHLAGDLGALTAALQRLVAARGDDDLDAASHAAIRLCVAHGVTPVRQRDHREELAKREKPKGGDKPSSSSSEVDESSPRKAAASERVPYDEVNKLGRDVAKPPSDKDAGRKGKKQKDPALSDKGAGDHTFNDPFDVLVKALERLGKGDNV